jgi:hypothetical protein
MRFMNRLNDQQRMSVEAWAMFLPAIVPIIAGVCVVEPIATKGRDFMARVMSHVELDTTSPLALSADVTDHTVVPLHLAEITPADAPALKEEHLAA